MGQKCEGNCGLWVLNEILKKTYPESLKKIVGAVSDPPAPPGGEDLASPTHRQVALEGR